MTKKNARSEYCHIITLVRFCYVTLVLLGTVMLLVQYVQEKFLGLR